MSVNKLGSLTNPPRLEWKRMKKVHIMVFLNIGMPQDTLCSTTNDLCLMIWGSENTRRNLCQKCGLSDGPLQMCTSHCEGQMWTSDPTCACALAVYGNKMPHRGNLMWQWFQLANPTEQTSDVCVYISLHIYRYLDEDALLTETCMRPLFKYVPMAFRCQPGSCFEPRGATGTKRREEKRTARGKKDARKRKEEKRKEERMRGR